MSLSFDLQQCMKLFLTVCENKSAVLTYFVLVSRMTIYPKLAEQMVFKKGKSVKPINAIQMSLFYYDEYLQKREDIKQKKCFF